MFKSKIRSGFSKLMRLFYPDLALLDKLKEELKGTLVSTELEDPVKLYPPFRIYNSKIGRYTYISERAIISKTTIGRFCSIGPGLLCGWGIHPLNGISTSPMFYSTIKQNGFSLTATDKIAERKEIIIGNDVFIGANVIILDGVIIGDGAVVGAGCVVSKNVPPYAIVAGVPMKILRHRFNEKEVEELLRIKWWNETDNGLQKVEKFFFDKEGFLKRNDNN